jgi:hypothetical protein
MRSWTRSCPRRRRFESVVGELVDEMSARFPDRTIRAFGEMVDLLWSEGRERAAIALEELWNDLAETRSFALLCGYHLDIFELGVQRHALPEVLRTHSHARTADEPSRLAAAVDQALAEVVGPFRAARIYLDVAEHVPRGSVPRAQAVLNWLSAGDARSRTRSCSAHECTTCTYAPPRSDEFPRRTASTPA